MTLRDFKQSLDQAVAPVELAPCLKALWEDGKGNWEAAHDIIEVLADEDAAWIHAYLHRKEGDEWNAGYWYRRAGKQHPKESLEAEWESLVSDFLGRK